MSYKYIKYEIKDRVLTLTYNRPEQLNAFIHEMEEEIKHALSAADKDDNIRVIIVTGEGRGFCSGMDLSAGNAFNYHEEKPEDHRDGGGTIALRVFEMKKPMIAAINGPAVGVGITATLPMDIRIASTKAKFGFVFARRGIANEACSSYFLPRVVGISKAMEWALSGRIISPQEALDGGLVSQVVEPEELLPTAYAIAKEIADYTAPVSVALVRQLFWRGLGMNHPMDAHEIESMIIEWIGRQKDSYEGVASFTEKRLPEFTMSPEHDMPGFYPWWAKRTFRMARREVMRMKRILCDMLGIEYPIISSGMQWLSRAELAAAVSNAGALGTITAAAHSSKKSLAKEIRKTKLLTDNPFSVNISMLPDTISDLTSCFFDVVVEERVAVVETAGRSPEAFMPKLKEAGIKVIHKVPAVRFAKKAERVGVDAVLVVGFECGGQPGMDDIGSMVIIPRAADELSIPVIAGGGIADSRGMAAAMILGASGVAMGTRMMASTECIIHPTFKRWMVEAKETETAVILRSQKTPMRVINNSVARHILSLESNGADPNELRHIMAGKANLTAMTEGELELGTLAMGQCVGLIHEIKPVKEIIEEVMAGAIGILGPLEEKRAL